MATQFIYQPHIHADGMVITPDLPLSRLVILAEGGPHPAPVKRLHTDQVVQAVDLTTQVRPATALIAASEGTLVVPAAVLLPMAVTDRKARALAAEVILSRQCWRLKDLTGGFRARLGDHGGGVVDAAAATRANGGDGAMMPYGRIVVIVEASGEPLSKGPHVVTVSAAAGALTHRFFVDILADAAE